MLEIESIPIIQNILFKRLYHFSETSCPFFLLINYDIIQFVIEMMVQNYDLSNWSLTILGNSVIWRPKITKKNLKCQLKECLA